MQPTTNAPAYLSNPAVVKVCERAIARGATFKIEASHVAAAPALYDLACWYLGEYQGTLAFLLDVGAKLDHYGSISHNQAKGALNCLLSEYKRAKADAARAAATEMTIAAIAAVTAAPAEAPYKFPEEKIPDPKPLSGAKPPVQAEPAPAPAPVKPRLFPGRYTIVLNDKGDYRTLRIKDCPAKFNKPDGTQIAEYLRGPDNGSDYTGFAFVLPNGMYSLWGSYKGDGLTPNALRVLLDDADPIRFGEAYALKSGTCFHCGRDLTVPDSVKRGLGPICAAKAGL